MANNYVFKVKHDSGNISVCFNIEDDRVMEIGENMNEINENAYMNGYNWEAVLNHYLKMNNTDVFEGMESDPEAGMYVAYYNALDTDGDKKADKLIEVIKDLIENEPKLYDFIRTEGDNIEWD